MATPPGAIDRSGATLGSPKYRGTIAATTTSGTTVVAPAGGELNSDLSGKVLLVCNDSDTATVRIHPVLTAASVVTTDRTGNFGVRVGPGECKELTMKAGESFLAAIVSTGATANVDVWELG